MTPCFEMAYIFRSINELEDLGSENMADTHRRNFLYSLAVLGLGAGIPVLTWAPQGKAQSRGQISKTMPLMNTLVTIEIRDSSREHALEAQEAAFQAMREVLPIFDRFRTDSHISHLNQSGILRDVPQSLNQVLTACTDLYEHSQGHFDITILPLLQASRHALRRTGNPLPPRDIEELREVIGFQGVRYDPKNVRLDRSGMQITLDGIAKGHIVDRAVAALRTKGVHRALVNAGGDIRVIGGSLDLPWRIGIQDPTRKDRHLAQLALGQAAVATSGSYEQFFDPLARHHHLIDSTGYSPRRPLSVTVVAPTAMQADGLATALFLMPLDQGLQLASSLSGVQAAIITRGNRILTTPGWDRLMLSKQA